MNDGFTIAFLAVFPPMGMNENVLLCSFSCLLF